ncbi:MAG: TerB family tellurite resistance protein [Aquisalimonadaceae bacterium]
MLDVIKKYFRDHLEPGRGHEESAEQQLRLATAALLIEVSRADNQINQAEQEAIATSIRDKFELTDAETEELVSLARREAEETVSYYGFTSLINEHFGQQQKERVIELMWRVAAADRYVDKHQEALVRKIADLLYVPHRVFITTKLSVLEENAMDSDGSNS